MISRYSSLPPSIIADRVVVSATDIYGKWHHHQKSLLDDTEGHGACATLVCVSQWQASLFPETWRKQVIPAMLDDYIYELNSTAKNPNKFVYASAAVKGWDATLAMWKGLRSRHPELREAELHVTTPGYDQPTDDGSWAAHRVYWAGVIPPKQLAAFMADAAGLVYVNTFPETFCAVAAIAEAVGCQCHILLAGSSEGAIRTTTQGGTVTSYPEQFEREFVELYNGILTVENAPPNDFRVSSVIPRWLEVLGLESDFVLRRGDPPTIEDLPLNPGNEAGHVALETIAKTKKPYTPPTLTRLVPEPYVSPRNRRRWEEKHRVKPPTIGLVMIAKNEALVLPRSLASVKSIVDTYTIVLDSKNDDNSEEVIREVAGDIPGRVLTGVPFTGLADARNEALRLAGPYSDYLLMLDCDDMFVVGDTTLLKHLTHDAYEVWFEDGGRTYVRTQLFKSTRGFYYKGVAHEWLQDPSDVTKARLAKETLYYMRLGGGWAGATPEATRRKYLRDVALFRRELDRDPTDARSQYYLAQSLKDAGDTCWGTPEGDELHLRSIVEYEKRTKMENGFWEEIFISWMQIGDLSSRMGGELAERNIPKAYLRAIERDYRRVEPAWALGRYYNGQGKHALGFAFTHLHDLPLVRPADALLLDNAIWDWRWKFERALSEYYRGEGYRESSRKLWEELLTEAPEEQHETIRKNLEWYR